MSRLTRDGTDETVSRDQILRRERGQGNINFPCSADHVQDWQPYPVDPYSCHMCDHTYYPYHHVDRVTSASGKYQNAAVLPLTNMIFPCAPQDGCSSMHLVLGACFQPMDGTILSPAFCALGGARRSAERADIHELRTTAADEKT